MCSQQCCASPAGSLILLCSGRSPQSSRETKGVRLGKSWPSHQGARLSTHFQISCWEHGGLCVWAEMVWHWGTFSLSVCVAQMDFVRVPQPNTWLDQTDCLQKILRLLFDFFFFFFGCVLDNFSFKVKQSFWNVHCCWWTVYIMTRRTQVIKKICNCIERIQRYVTLLSHISNLYKYSAPSRYFSSEFSYESSLSAQHMWIWGFALIFPCRFGQAW